MLYLNALYAHEISNIGSPRPKSISTAFFTNIDNIDYFKAIGKLIKKNHCLSFKFQPHSWEEVRELLSFFN